MSTESAIRTSESVCAISEALSSVQPKISPVSKSGVNQHQRYRYAKLEDYVEEIRPALAEAALTILTGIGNPKWLEPRQGKNSTQYCVQVLVTTRILHKTGEWIEISCYGEGQDTGDKAIYKAITGGRKYALACLLNLATTDDPEDEKKQEKNTHNGIQYHQASAAQHEKYAEFTEQSINKIASTESLDVLQNIFAEVWRKIAVISDETKKIAISEKIKEAYQQKKNIFLGDNS